MTLRRRVLITGGNAGIGRAAARQLLEGGCEVVLGCRDEARGDEAARQLRSEVAGAEVSVLRVDMASQRSIRDASAQIRRLDVIIHNAAYFDIRAKSRALSDEGIEITWATNHLGPALMTELLLPRLRESLDARVVAVTSKGLMMFPRLAVDLVDPEFKARRFTVPRAYYQSKLAHLAWMLNEAERERASRVQFHAVRVTNVKIDLARYPGLAWPLRAMYAIKSSFSITPEQMAETYTWLATHPVPGATTGGYWDGPNAPATVSKWATVPEHRGALDILTRHQIQGA